MAYQPGQFSQRVRFEKQNAGATSFEARQWVILAEQWARIVPLKSSEPVLADQVQQVLTHSVTVRLTRTLAVPVDAAQWRIVYTHRYTGAQHTLAIVGPGRAIESMYLQFSCVEGLADGH